MHDCIALILIQTFEVIRLYSVRREHRLLCCGILSHEVVIKSEVNLSRCVLLQVLGELHVAITFLPS